MNASYCCSRLDHARKHLYLSGILSIALCGVLAGCHDKSASSAHALQPQAPTVSVASVETKNVPIYAEYVGQTDAKSSVKIVARVAGYLEGRSFFEGWKVKAGQVLFKIEQAPYQAALQAAEAKLAQDEANLLKAEKDVARLEPLVKEEAAPAQDLDAVIASRAQYKAAIQSDQASIATARLNLSYTIIRSPMDGVIGKSELSSGNLVGQNEPTLLATVSSYDPIYVNFAVPEASYLNFRAKHVASPWKVTALIPLELVMANNEPFPYKGVLNFADRTVDPKTGTLMLRGQFPNPDALLRPGQFARVRFVVEERPNAILVPKQAITETLNAKSVLVVDASGKAALRTIATDGEFGQYSIVHSGLQGGEQVIVEGAQKVRPGMKVIPKAALPATAKE
jgi:membrane fusion protein (multidrug efflux system)